MKILMAASECVPFVKVGGLADVVGTLPQFLRDRKHDVRVVIPKYRQVDADRYGLKTLPFPLRIPVADQIVTGRILEGRTPHGAPVYFIENDRYFNRPEVYRSADGDYPDNRERFIFFSRAVLETAKALGFQPDVIHCHDWQTGIIPAYLKTLYSIDAFYCMTSTVYTIHNIAYQGSFDAATLGVGGFSKADFTWNRLEFYGRFNFMKAGIVYADAISTVSPTYAKEIVLTDEGRGMEGILRARQKDVFGILNGIDYEEWNPRTDPGIAGHFSGDDAGNKAVCKEDLQQSCRLPVNPNTLVIGAVSRLDPQKGYDLVARVMPELLGHDIQFVVLGSGDRSLHELLANMARMRPDKVSYNPGYNNPLAHKIYAGSDLFLMPSRFEPCGLGQMIALSYGTVPLVHKTGGLADTIVDFTPRNGKGNGFSFRPLGAVELRTAIERAVRTYRNKALWSKLMANAFRSDFSWNRAVKEYIKLYERSVENARSGKRCSSV